MSVAQISFLCAFLLFCFLAVRLEWEIPFDFGKAWLLVVGGFPCHRYSVYETFSIPSPRAGNPPASVVYNLPWKCDSLMQSGNECLTTLSQCPVGNSSQYSVDNWAARNISCKKGGRRVECFPIRREGDVCQNVVTKIANYTNIIQIDIQDYPLPSKIIQRFENIPEDLDESLCYQTGDSLVVRTRQNTSSEVFNLSSLEFNVNATYKRVVEEKDCDSFQKRLDPDYFVDSTFCNCQRCEISVISVVTPPNGTCVVPVAWELVIPAENGRVIGVVLKLSWRDIDVSRPLIVTYKTTYPPYASTIVNSRFWSTRGRFHCPSEVTCWEELWYPLWGWTELKASHAAILVVIAAVSALLIWK